MKILLKAVLMFLLLENKKVNCDETQPSFAEPLPNVTVPVGRDVNIPCIVENLGSNRAAWIKVESKAILSIHDHVITRNYRISLNHVDNRNFVLQIKDVKESDRGGYMCQVNTAPMISQVGYLDVVYPPQIKRENTSSDIGTKEGSNVTLTCVVTGYPTPSITWRREDGQPITQSNTERHFGSDPNQVSESMNLVRVNRNHSGAYLCIAMNGVPPSVSQRILLQVYFPPEIETRDTEVSAHLGATVLLSCYIQAHPFPDIVWKQNESEITSGEQYEIDVAIKHYKIQTVLRIPKLQAVDFGKFRCLAENRHGTAEKEININEIPRPTLAPTFTSLLLSASSMGTSSWNDMPSHSELEEDLKLLSKEPPQTTKANSPLFDEVPSVRRTQSSKAKDPVHTLVGGHKGNGQSRTTSSFVFELCAVLFILQEVVT
ncbi:lachesin-like isoform X2 [Tachypleus tridentatus]|uniref:lachesin-like isoform X2 n=1 Tax=Tachypleus tridentatus TaxID=6853 RepID=UPI003FD45659